MVDCEPGAVGLESPSAPPSASPSAAVAPAPAPAPDGAAAPSLGEGEVASPSVDVVAVGVLVVDVCAVLGAMVSLGEVSAAALAVVVVVVVDVVGAALEAAAGVGDWSLLPLLVGSGAVDDVAADCMVALCARVCVAMWEARK